MSTSIETQAKALHRRVSHIWSDLYDAEAEALRLGLNDCLENLKLASSHADKAACSLHLNRAGTDLARLTAEQMAQGAAADEGVVGAEVVDHQSEDPNPYDRGERGYGAYVAGGGQ